MANSKLYDVLSTLYSNDLKLNNKITGVIANQLSGDGTSIAINNKQISVKDGGISSGKLATNAVTSGKILDGAVTSGKLDNNAVVTAKINDAAVTSSKLATDSVITVKIADGAVTSSKLADNAVVTAKINDKAVTSAKLADAVWTEIQKAHSHSNKAVLDGITAANITDWNNGKALTGLVQGKHINISTSANKATINVVTSGLFASNDTGIVSGGLLYKTISNLKGTATANGDTLGELESRISSIESIGVANVLTGLTVNSPLTGGTVTAHKATIGIQNGTTSQKGAVQLTDTIANDSTKAATPKAVSAYVSGAVANSHTHTNKGVLDGISAADITNWNNGATVSSVTLSAITTETGYAASYKLMVNGSAVGNTINIIKDQFLKDVTFIAVATAADVTAAGSNPGFSAGDPVIKFTFDVNPDATDTYIYVPVKDLVDTYTGGANIKVDANNVISLSGTIPSANLPSIPSSKLPSDVAYVSGTMTANQIAVAAADKKVKTTGFAIGATTSADFGSTSEVAVESAVKQYITGYVDGAMTAVHTHDNMAVLTGITAAKVTNWDNTYGKISGYTINTASGSVTSSATTTISNTASLVQYADATYVKGSGLTANNVVLGNGTTNVKISSITSAALNNAITYAGDWNSSKSTITGNIDTLSGKISGAYNANAGKIVTTKASSGGIQASSYEVGGTTSSGFGLSTKVAVESAVTGYIAGQGFAKSTDLSKMVTADNNFTSGYLVVASGNNRKVQTGYEVVKSVTSGSTDNQIATAKAVYAHDAYILNGALAITDGVEEWGADSGAGSLTDIQSKINALNAQIG